MKSFRIVLSLLMVLTLAACSSTRQVDSPSNLTVNETPTPKRTNELTRDIVLNLVRSKLASAVKARMNTSSNAGQGNLTEIYSSMIKEKIIKCAEYSDSCLCWNKCRPGANSRGLFLNSPEQGMVTGTMAVVIGNKVPKEVTGISKSSDSTAIADVVLSFESNDGYKLYSEYSGAFWNANNTGSERRKVFLRLYDDGWRVEQVSN